VSPHGFASELSHSLFVGYRACPSTTSCFKSLLSLLICNNICSFAICPFPTVPLSRKNPQRYQRSEQSAATRRPPSTQLKPISIFLKGEFEAAHSRKVGTVSGDPPKTCIAPSLNSDRSAIPQKSATLLKGGICCAPRALTVGRLSCR
jgi:hypothetical protein